MYKAKMDVSETFHYTCLRRGGKVEEDAYFHYYIT
jgi:hypothetical protein